MGNMASREFSNVFDSLQPNTCDPFRTPTSRASRPFYVISDKDPRSPSAGIFRTPIEIPTKQPLSKEHNTSDITPILQRRHSTFVPAPVEDDVEEESRCQLVISDPRSPSVAFSRTPILVERTTKDESCHVVPQKKFHLDTKMDSENSNTKTTVLVSDPRSPSDEFCRTPIQVCVISESEVMPVFDLNQQTTEIKSETATAVQETTVNVTVRNGSISTYGSKSLKEMQIIPQVVSSKEINNSENEYLDRDKENEVQLKRKLFLTPESSPVAHTAFKVRTPLGTMSNLQHSASLFLRMKQCQKIEQNPQSLSTEFDPALNKIYSNSRVKKENQKQPIAEWDTNSTFLI